MPAFPEERKRLPFGSLLKALDDGRIAPIDPSKPEEAAAMVWGHKTLHVGGSHPMDLKATFGKTGVCVFCSKETTTKAIPLSEFDFDETPDDQSVQLGQVVACGECWRKTLHETISKAVSDAVKSDAEQLETAEKEVEQVILDKVIDMFLREAK